MSSPLELLSPTEIATRIVGATAWIALALAVDGLLRRRAGRPAWRAAVLATGVGAAALVFAPGRPGSAGAPLGGASIPTRLPAAVVAWCAESAGARPPGDVPTASFPPADGAAESLPRRAAARAIFACWLGGAVACAVGAFVGSRRLRRRLVARSSAAEPDLVARGDACAARLGLRRAPQIRRVDDALAPCVVGRRNPVVFLPRSLHDAAETEAALLHEFAHVVRRDLAFATAFRLLSGAYWFHPIVRALVRRLTELREIGCDALDAEHAAGGVRGYRAALLTVAARRHGVAVPAVVAGFASPAGLLVRLRALEDLAAETAPAAAADPAAGAAHAHGAAARFRSRRRCARAAALCGVLAAAALPVWTAAPTAAASAPTVSAAPAGSDAPVAASAAPVDPAASPDDEALAAARALWERRANGARESCFHTRFAAVRLANAATPSPAPAEKSP